MAMNRTATCSMGLLALGLAAAGCTSRTLPLPPPVVDEVAPPSVQGLVLVTGMAHEGATVGILNERTMTGVLVTSEETNCASACPFEAYVEAEVGDRLRVWQFFDTPSSTEVIVPER